MAHKAGEEEDGYHQELQTEIPRKSFEWVGSGIDEEDGIEDKIQEMSINEKSDSVNNLNKEEEEELRFVKQEYVSILRKNILY